jgi:hypothetical protein
VLVTRQHWSLGDIVLGAGYSRWLLLSAPRLQQWQQCQQLPVLFTGAIRLEMSGITMKCAATAATGKRVGGGVIIPRSAV